MKILLVGGYSTNEQSVATLEHFVAYMGRELNGHELNSAYLDEILYEFSNNKIKARLQKTKEDISNYDAVYVRGPGMQANSEQAYYLSRFCALNNVRCVNDYSLYYPGTKVAQTIIFYEENAPFLDTIYIASNKDLVDEAEAKFGYPYILKATTGSHGDANYLVSSKQEASDVLASNSRVDFLAQQYCENDRDYRILLTPNQTLIFARRGRPDTHLNNTSKGGSADLANGEIPNQLVEKSRAIAKRLNLEIAGVDLMPRYGSDQYFFLEVNSQPQLMTGAFLEEKADLIRSLF